MDLPLIEPNDVKKGAKVWFKDGREGIVFDNRKGNMRMVKIPVFGMEGMYDIGSEYTHKWSKVEQLGIMYEVEIPESYKHMEKMVDAIFPD